MWHKVSWLVLWTTLCFWAGCTGENQNYKINEDREPMFEENYPTQPGGSDAGQQRKEQKEPAATEKATASADDGQTGGSAQQRKPVTGVSRDDWQRLGIGPQRGLVPHHPKYFGERLDMYVFRTTPDRPSPLSYDGDFAAQATAATRGARDGDGGGKVLDAGLGTVKAGLDLGLMPLYMLDQPPWTIRYSPQHSYLRR